jgi:hypothetical protein
MSSLPGQPLGKGTLEAVEMDLHGQSQFTCSICAKIFANRKSRITQVIYSLTHSEGLAYKDTETLQGCPGIDMFSTAVKSNSSRITDERSLVHFAGEPRRDAVRRYHNVHDAK